jgi:propanol-preferring alcohol dehydrogenase
VEDIPPAKLDCAIIFAPAGALAINALKVLDKGGRLTLAGIYMTPIPEMEYKLIYEERRIQSVANSTREDVEQLLTIASQVPLVVETQVFPLEEANLALSLLKRGEIQGSGVMAIP